MKNAMKKLTVVTLFLLVICLLSACATPGDLPLIPNDSRPTAGTDGEIKGSAQNGFAEDMKGDYEIADDDAIWDGEAEESADEDVAWDAPADSMEPMAPDSAMPGDGDYGGISNGGMTQQAGQLTASEWRDLENWDAFKALVNQNNFYSIAEQWSTYATSRIKVTVSCYNAPVKGAKVELLDENGTLLWGAVTDHTGTAYAFYNVTNPKGTQQPHRVRVVAANGVTTIAALSEGDEEIDIKLEGAANPEITLDLMLMVDTTGSMGDELEYLKAELGDVVTRAAKDSNVTVRTSVNFYRDTTDEYIVRYYDFRDSVDEAVALLAQQHANGGGDYPEAVHTALDNAINGHAWRDHSVKLLFFVFDAPPHDESDVMLSLQNSIKAAAELGIRIIPVASSGVNDTCQLLFRSYAALTGGTYTYLTNHSGIGGSHATPELPEEPGVERLNDMMVRIISEYCQ